MLQQPLQRLGSQFVWVRLVCPGVRELGRGDRVLCPLPDLALAASLDALLLLGVCGVRLLLGRNGEPVDAIAVRRACGDEVSVISWKPKKCGCVKATLTRAAKVAIRCDRHRGKPAKKRLLCHFEEGMVRRG